MFKKIISLILAIMMIMSLVTVMATSTGAVTYENTKLYFDVDSTGWTMGKSDKVGFYVHSLANGEELAWGGKKLNGVNEGDGIWSYDPSKYMNLQDGIQYQVIFTGAGNQTADLFFDTTCFGHVAYCNGEFVENTVDSSKKNQVALWKDLDPTDYGPVKGVTSLGNLVGTCLPQGETDESLFTNWLTDTGSTGLKNAMKYTVQPGTKTAQKLVDDLAGALNLTKDFVKTAIEENADAIAEAIASDPDITKPFDWSYDASDLPTAEVPHTHTPGEPVKENEKAATCTEDGSYDEVVYCVEDGEELSRETKTVPALGHTPGEAVVENEKAATCTEEGSYDEVVYCTVCGAELSREAKTIEKIAHTPGEAVKENEKAATCTEEGSYDEVVYCTVCGEELSREAKTTGTIAHTLTLVEEVPATEDAEGVKAHYVCSVCEKLFFDASGAVEATAEELVIPTLAHTHVPAEAVVENEKAATCEEDGSYDLVVYCEKCGEKLETETVTIPALGHDLQFVEEVEATASVDGVKAHYECTRCGKLFDAEDQTKEVTAEELAIKAEHVRGDADGDGELDIVDATVIQRYLANMISEEALDAVAADADLDGEIDIVDATLIQRVILKICDWDKKPVTE